MTIAIFNFLGFWNEYVFALILMTDRAEIHHFGRYRQPCGGCLLYAQLGHALRRLYHCDDPCIVLYCFFQRNISEGMTSGAVKG